jgi:hypothetical protein
MRSIRSTAARRVVLVVLTVPIALAVTPKAASAHDVTFGQSKILQEGEVVHYDLAVEYGVFAALVAETDGSDLWPLTEPDPDLEQALHDRNEVVEEVVLSHVKVFLDDVECGGMVRGIELSRFRGSLYVLMSLTYECPRSPSGSYEVHYDLFFDPSSVGRGHAHANIADYSLGGTEGRIVFEPGRRRLVTGQSDPFASAWRFVRLGVEHILGGVDHVLTLLAEPGDRLSQTAACSGLHLASTCSSRPRSTNVSW